MRTLEPNTLQLPERYLEIVKALLRRHLPQSEIWAYGSRVTGGGHEASDLDLVVRNPDALSVETPGLAAMKDAFVESNLPIRVDVMDWARLPESFRQEIERAHVVILRPPVSTNG
jgi:predicted nucleotidyltransferase